ENKVGGIERRLEVQLRAPVPEAKLQFSDAGLEFVVRYPVDIRRASEIDDHVTRSVLDLLDKEAELKGAVAGTPKIRAAIKGLRTTNFAAAAISLPISSQPRP